MKAVEDIIEVFPIGDGFLIFSYEYKRPAAIRICNVHYREHGGRNRFVQNPIPEWFEQMLREYLSWKHNLQKGR